MNYFRNLTTANSGESSKRFISLYATGLLTIVIICCLFGLDIKAIDTIIYALVSLCLGSSAMSLVTRNSSTKVDATENYNANPPNSTVFYDQYGTYREEGISEEEMKI